MQLKEKTLQQIEEVDKHFTAFHNTLVEDESQFVNSKCFIGADKQGNAKVKVICTVEGQSPARGALRFQIDEKGQKFGRNRTRDQNIF